ncbi:MAG: hypothetical protein V7672_08520 [Brevundimonas sp.]|uniref:DUF6891 domain-containing protein n=1 Tax=Brevundimonas sp. TaxID=1871086 RepID=UPI003002E2AD
MFKFLTRLFGRGSPKAPKPDVAAPPPPGARYEPTEADILGDLQRYIEVDVAGGFVPAGEIAERAVEVLEGEADAALLRREARRLTAEALAAHEAAKAQWPEVTDCDRLDAAFAALEASGVIARQNFTCCGTCGAYEIGGELEDARSQGRPARGYAFYHQQDTERGIEGEGLYLNYGACEEGEDAAVAIGHEIVAALKAKGLSPDWDGRIEQRIGVPLDWKRRGPAPAGMA